MKTIWSDHESSPWDYAVGHFRCALSRARLKATPEDELRAVFGRAQRLSRSRLASVYVIGSEANSLVKIGYADNIRSRFASLNSSSPVQLHLKHFVHVVDGLIAKRVEGQTHRILAEYRKRGEWFDVSVDQAADAIAEVLLTEKLRWWTEQECRDLAVFVEDSWREHRARERLFGT